MTLSKVSHNTYPILRLTTALAIATSLGAGCAPPPAEEPPPVVPSLWVYDCGGTYKFTAQFRESEVLLSHAESTQTLPQAISASGARYSDGETTFRINGREALLESPGTSYPACTGSPADGPWEAARMMGMTYRALGQEPGWVVQIEGDETIVFIGDYGETRTSAPVSARDEGEAGAVVWRGETAQGAITVTIENQPCSDVMSGEPFPDTVTVNYGGRDYRGCGRPLG